ncbi:MAG: serine/threonine protein kinase [Planctomycetaceae bacterium]|nr:serine/threonine protein kinase [Planctomycetaceae bacterium]
MADVETVQCVLCGHIFHPGNVDGYVYCSSCGRRFNPALSHEETVSIPGPVAEKTEPALADSDESEEPPPASRRFGEYDVLEEIARGGMGVVYLARQRVLRRVVALKVLRSGDNASDEERRRLLREAKAAAGLSHPNIVPIHEFSIHQGQPYFTMDYIDGTPLDELLEKGPLKVRQAVEIIATVARAIAYAHTRGIIHRDLKPANIIITPDGRPMITDFGLAVEMTPEKPNRRRMTMDGSIMGTIPYAPPEQAAGKIDQITERSDVYSMGAVLYEMLTGRPPFTGFTQFELMRRVINHDPTLPRQLNPKIHRDVETIIMKCLEKEPRRRYASAKSFADDCQSFLKGEVIAARPVTIGYRCRRFIARRPLLNLLSALVLCLSLAVWVGIDHFRALAKEKEVTDLKLEMTQAETERLVQEKVEIESQVRRAWRTEYNINFDYYFRFESDIETSRRQGIPWLNPENTRNQPSQPVRVKLLADPPRLSLTDPDGFGAGPETPFVGNIDLGLPFSFPREVRLTLRLMTPPEGVGELILSLDVDRNYQPHLGTTTARFGSSKHPGVYFYRSGAVIGEDASFAFRPNTTIELVLERSDDRLRAYIDGRLVLESEDPPPVFNSDAGRVTLDVKDGTLELLDLSMDLRGMSRNLATSLIETANAMAARGRAELAQRLFVSVLLEPTDAQNHLRALRGYARSVWQALPRRDRNLEGIQQACRELSEQLATAGHAQPGMIDYLIGLVLSSNQGDSAVALSHLDSAAAKAYSGEPESSVEYGDLARLEAIFVYLHRNMLGEAARRFNIMFEDGTTSRLYERFGAELSGGGHVALLLEKADPLIRNGEELETAAGLLRAAASIAPSSRECANHFRRLGRVHAGLGEADKAVEYMHWAERLSPDWFRPYLDEARIHFDNDAVGKGEEALVRATTAIPQSLDLHLGIAKLYLEELPAALQDPVKAEAAAKVAVTLSNSGNPLALHYQAEAISRQKVRLAEALNAVNAAINIESSKARIELRDHLVRELQLDQ